MSDIESRARNSVLRLVLGGDAPRTEKEQEQLATWCFLKALSVELGRPEDHRPTYPPGMFQAFAQHRKPPPTTAVVIIGRRSTIPTKLPTYIWFETQGESFKPWGEDGATADGYRASFVVGHFVFKVAGILAPVHLKMETDDWHVELWPSLRGPEIEWPPPSQFIDFVDGVLV